MTTFKRLCVKDGNNFAIHEWEVDLTQPPLQIKGNAYQFNTRYIGKVQLCCSQKESIQTYLKHYFARS